MFRVLLFSLAVVSFSVAAANNDDGFVWIDANTKIKLKPTGSNAGNAAAGGTNDFLADLGRPGEYDHPKVREAYERTIAACTERAKQVRSLKI